MVARKLFNVALYVRGLSCYSLFFGTYTESTDEKRKIFFQYARYFET